MDKTPSCICGGDQMGNNGIIYSNSTCTWETCWKPEEEQWFSARRSLSIFLNPQPYLTSWADVLELRNPWTLWDLNQNILRGISIMTWEFLSLGVHLSRPFWTLLNAVLDYRDLMNLFSKLLQHSGLMQQIQNSRKNQNSANL